jgi:hypothetical protein
MSVVGDMHPDPLGNPLAKIWGAPMGCHLTEMITSSIKWGKQLHKKGTELVLFCDEFLQSRDCPVLICLNQTVVRSIGSIWYDLYDISTIISYLAHSIV